MFSDKGFIFQGSLFTPGHSLILKNLGSSWDVMGFINMLPALIPHLWPRYTEGDSLSFPATGNSPNIDPWKP